LFQPGLRPRPSQAKPGQALEKIVATFLKSGSITTAFGISRQKKPAYSTLPHSASESRYVLNIIEDRGSMELT
jgi:hypothetical protein